MLLNAGLNQVTLIIELNYSVKNDKLLDFPILISNL